MLDPAKLSFNTLSAILENEPKETVHLLSVEEAFDKFLTWHGIIGYTSLIMNTLKEIQNAEIR